MRIAVVLLLCCNLLVACDDAETPGGAALRNRPHSEVIRLQSKAPRSITTGGSRRDAIVTDQTPERFPLTLSPEMFPAGAELRFSLVGRRKNGRAPIEAFVEWRTPGERLEIFRGVVSNSKLWRDHQVELPKLSGDGELVFGASSGASVVWAGIEIVPLGERASPPASRPNIILVIVDTLRADHVSAYGYPRQTTPHLDALAREGLLFRRAFSSSTWTLPSVATLLTGLLPAEHGVRSIENRLALGITTAAESLRAAGYTTCAFTDGGFLAPQWGFGQGFDRYDFTAGNPWDGKDVAQISRAATDWLKAKPREPFFLLLHTYEPHQPYVNREGFADRYLKEGGHGKEPAHVGADARKSEILPTAELERMIALYDGGVLRADHYLGEVLDVLEQTNLLERSALIVTSDHGEEFQEHGGREHGFGKVFDENIRVPLILRPPGGEVGAVIEESVSGLDVAPTLLHLAGIEDEGGGLGTSLLRIAAENIRRPTLVEGINSYPDLSEDRIRLDDGGEAWIVDRQRETLERFDLTRDAGMLHPTQSALHTSKLGDRLQMSLAWLRGSGKAARIAPDLHALELEPSNGFRPLGVFTGPVWRALGDPNDTARLELDAGTPSLLVFESATGTEPSLSIEQVGGDKTKVLLQAWRNPGGDESWNPLIDALPPYYRFTETRGETRQEKTKLNAQDRQELRALGYIEE